MEKCSSLCVCVCDCVRGKIKRGEQKKKKRKKTCKTVQKFRLRASVSLHSVYFEEINVLLFCRMESFFFANRTSEWVWGREKHRESSGIDAFCCASSADHGQNDRNFYYGIPASGPKPAFWARNFD